MKIPKFISAFFGSFVGPSGEIIDVIPNDRGGFSLRTEDDTEPVGNYPTAEDAMRVVSSTGATPRLLLSQYPEHPAGALKYVVIRERNGTERYFFCLPPTTHYELADTFAKATGGRVVSAGFVTLLGATARTLGESESLKLKPRDEDARVISAMYRVTARMSPPVQHQTHQSYGHTHQSSHA